VKRLEGAHEIIDGPLMDGRELAGNLRDLRRTNRWLWGTALSGRAVEKLIRAGDDRHAAEVSLLDVGTGSADIPLALLAAAERSGRRLAIVATDARPEVLAASIRLDPALRAQPGLALRVAEGTDLPFGDGAFDVAHASLVLHHLDPDDAVRLLRELRRVARRGVVVNDLLRSRLNVLGAHVLARLATRNRLTRNDAPLSVRRSYTERELGVLLARAGLEPLLTLRDPLRQRVAIAAARATG
jgi:SAM-dependent methyltransferase